MSCRLLLIISYIKKSYNFKTWHLNVPSITYFSCKVMVKYTKDKLHVWEKRENPRGKLEKQHKIHSDPWLMSFKWRWKKLRKRISRAAYHQASWKLSFTNMTPETFVVYILVCLSFKKTNYKEKNSKLGFS